LSGRVLIKKNEKKERNLMMILIGTMLYVSSNNTIASQRDVKTILHWVRMPVFSLGIVLNTMLFFPSGLSYCERILQASSSLDRRSDFSCQGCWLGSQGACVSKINYFQGFREEALFSPVE